MKLYYSDASPFARRARAVACEKGIALDPVIVDVFSDDEEFLKVNPLGKIPALLADDGTAYCDSAVICEYLDNQKPTPRLIPPAPSARIEVLRRDMLAIGVMEAAVRLIIESRRPEGTRWALWVGRQEKTIHRTLDLIEKTIAQWEKDVTLAEITLGCALGYIDFRHPYLGWRSTRPQLAAWYERLSQRPSLRTTAPGAQAKAA